MTAIKIKAHPVSIHAPLARSNSGVGDCVQAGCVSIHAPLARSNGCPLIFRFTSSTFQYMLLLRGATTSGASGTAYHWFQYMLLLRGATQGGTMGGLREKVSIHAPLARSNAFCCISSPIVSAFQYMLLLRGATRVYSGFDSVSKVKLFSEVFL